MTKETGMLKVIAGIGAVIFTMVLAVWFAVGFFVYTVATDPQGAAEKVGTVTNSVVEGFKEGFNQSPEE